MADRKTVPLRFWQFAFTRFTAFEYSLPSQFIWGIFFKLGGVCPSKWLPFRLVAGVWTLAAFFFVQSYTSTLFTYVVTPINPPLINSVDDIVDNGDINLLVRETGFLNTLLLASHKINEYSQSMNNEYERTARGTYNPILTCDRQPITRDYSRHYKRNSILSLNLDVYLRLNVPNWWHQVQEMFSLM